jgi:polyisoprenoid-binding protein YceI
MKASLLLSLAYVSVVTWGAVQSLKPEGSSVEFQAKTKPVPITILGKGSSISGQITLDGDNTFGKLEFGLATLTTGIGKRDEHMKDKYLEVEKFPTASLTIQKTSSLAGWSKEKPVVNKGYFLGNLNLHGVTKPVTGNFNVSESGKVEVQFQVKLTDYGIVKPYFAGISVDDNIDVEVKIDRFQ